MFKRFVEKAASKASLFNIKADIGMLRRAIPGDSAAASKALLSLIENITLAFANRATTKEIATAAAEALARDCKELQELVAHAIALVEGVQSSDISRRNLAEDNLQKSFHGLMGNPVDRSQLPFLSRQALKEQSRFNKTTGQETRRSAQSDFEIGRAFRDKILERIRSGEIVGDLEALRRNGKPDTLKQFLEVIGEHKRSLDLLAHYGTTEDVRRMLRLIDHVLAEYSGA